MIDPRQMMDPQQFILGKVGLPTSPLPASSRYYGIEVATLVTSEGKEVAYLRRRFCPEPERFELLLEHVVNQGERLDNITAKYLSDPEQFWRLCDANRALHPKELTDTIGRRLRITMPEGIPGA
jgi:hypothetical protein